MHALFSKSHIINGALAIVFCFACHFFMTAYIGYTVKYKKLELLRGQERFVKNQLKELEEKKKVIEKTNNFIDQANESGLTKDQWDLFFVSLKDEPLSFLKLETILNQTSNSHQYYFKPDSFSIKTLGLKNSTAKEDQNGETSQLSEASQPINPGAGLTGSDVIISLKGHFLVKRRGPDG